jgi:hypothetical protein
MSRVIAVCGLVWIAAACAEAPEPEHTNALRTPDGRTPAAAVSGESASPPRAAMAAKLQVLQRNLSRSSAGLRAQSMAGGIRKIDLEGRFLHATVLEHRDDGAARRVCVDQPTAMAGMLLR